MNIIFLTYVNRSGSTYLANILSSSDDIFACTEGDILVSYFLEDPGKNFKFNESIVEYLSKMFREDSKLRYWGNGESFLKDLEYATNNLEAFIKILTNYKNLVKPGATFILFKAERLIYLVKKINKVETEHLIRFISIIRDPRAVYASQKKTVLPGILKFMSKNPVITTIKWRSHVKTCRSLVPSSGLFIKFEDLVKDYNAILQHLGSYLGTDLSSASPEYGDLYLRLTGPHVQIHKYIQEKPDKSKINSWQTELLSNEIITIDIMTSAYLKCFDYEIFRDGQKSINIYLLILYHLINYYISRILKKVKFHSNRILKGR